MIRYRESSEIRVFKTSGAPSHSDIRTRYEWFVFLRVDHRKTLVTRFVRVINV